MYARANLHSLEDTCKGLRGRNGGNVEGTNYGSSSEELTNEKEIRIKHESRKDGW